MKRISVPVIALCAIATLAVGCGGGGGGGTPALEVSVASQVFSSGQLYDFGNIADSASESATITIKNTGTGTLTVTNVQLVGDDTGDFQLVVPTLPANVAANGTATVTLTYQPTGSLFSRTSVVVENNSATPTLSLSLVGQQLLQPDGSPTVVPQGTALAQYLSVGEFGDTTSLTTDAIRPALSTYSGVFTQVGSTVTASVLSRGTTMYKNIFGWYNTAAPGQTASLPARADLQVMHDCNANAGASTGLDIASDLAFLGDKIAFFFITPESRVDMCATVPSFADPYLYVSDARLIGRDFGLPAGNNRIHVLIYKSTEHADRYYFCLEDTYSSGDNDFADMIVAVDGIRME